jgi:hypothetical protein
VAACVCVRVMCVWRECRAQRIECLVFGRAEVRQHDVCDERAVLDAEPRAPSRRGKRETMSRHPRGGRVA